MQQASGSYAVDMHPAGVRRTVQQRADIGQVVSATIASTYAAGMTTHKHMQRLQLLLSFLMDCSVATMVLFEGPWPAGCVWPLSSILVHDARAFYDYMLGRVLADTSGLFHVDSRRYPMMTQTYIVVFALRSVGMKPRFRGPHETEPGLRGEELYYKEWRFVNDDTFRQIVASNNKCDCTAYARAPGAAPTMQEARLILARFN